MERANSSIVGVNLTPTAKITASSSTGQDGWYVFNLTDGETKPSRQKGESIGWQSQNDATPALTFDFGESISFSEIKLYPSGALHDRTYGVHMPAGAVISVSNDGQSWTEAAAFTDYRYEGGTKGTPLTVNLNGATGRYLRVEITQAQADENDTPLTQLGEIEIFGSPAADKSELGSLMKQYVHFGGDTSAELYATVTAAVGNADSRQGYVDFLVKKLTPVVEVLESNYVETEPTPDTMGETQAPVTNAPDTSAELPTETDAPAKGGCSSAIGMGAVALMVAMAAGVALRKKDE
jgi:hypothetical protein